MRAAGLELREQECQWGWLLHRPSNELLELHSQPHQSGRHGGRMG